MDDCVLYEERQVFARRRAIGLTLFPNVVAAIFVLFGHLSFTQYWWVFLVATGAAAFWLVWIWIAFRMTPVRLDEQALRPPWRDPIPLGSIEVARVVGGDERSGSGASSSAARPRSRPAPRRRACLASEQPASTSRRLRSSGG